MVPSLAQFAEDKTALIAESEAGQDLNTLLGDKPFTATFSVPAVCLYLQAHRAVFWCHPSLESEHNKNRSGSTM